VRQARSVRPGSARKGCAVTSPATDSASLVARPPTRAPALRPRRHERRATATVRSAEESATGPQPTGRHASMRILKPRVAKPPSATAPATRRAPPWFAAVPVFAIQRQQRPAAPTVAEPTASRHAPRAVRPARACVGGLALISLAVTLTAELVVPLVGPPRRNAFPAAVSSVSRPMTVRRRSARVRFVPRAIPATVGSQAQVMWL